MLQLLLKIWRRTARRFRRFRRAWGGRFDRWFRRHARNLVESGRFNFARRFAGLTNGQIARGIAPLQIALLKKFFGRGVEGAEVAFRDFKIPEGLTRETLERYHEIARRQIEQGLDLLGVQRLRLRLVERALIEMDRLEH